MSSVDSIKDCFISLACVNFMVTVLEEQRFFFVYIWQVQCGKAAMQIFPCCCDHNLRLNPGIQLYLGIKDNFVFMLIPDWFSLRGKLPVIREPMESLPSEINLDPPLLFPTMTSQYYFIFHFESSIPSPLPTLPPPKDSYLN